MTVKLNCADINFQRSNSEVLSVSSLSGKKVEKGFSFFTWISELFTSFFNLLFSWDNNEVNPLKIKNIKPIQHQWNIKELLAVHETLKKIITILKNNPDLDISNDSGDQKEFIKLVTSLPTHLKADYSDFIKSGLKNASSFYESQLEKIIKLSEGIIPIILIKLIKSLKKHSQFLVEENPSSREIESLIPKLPSDLRNIDAFKNETNCGKLAAIIENFRILPSQLKQPIELIEMLEVFPNIEVHEGPNSNTISLLLDRLPKELKDSEAFKNQNNCGKLASLIKDFYCVTPPIKIIEYTGETAVPRAQTFFAATLQSPTGADFVVKTLPPIIKFEHSEDRKTFQFTFAADYVGSIGKVGKKVVKNKKNEEITISGEKMAENGFLHVKKILKGRVEIFSETVVNEKTKKEKKISWNEIIVENDGFIAKKSIGELNLKRLIPDGLENLEFAAEGKAIINIPIHGPVEQSLGECRRTYTPREFDLTFTNLTWETKEAWEAKQSKGWF